MKTTKRQLEIYLMVGAIILIFFGIPAGVWAGNSFNTFLAGSVNYDQLENETDFYDGPIIDGDDQYQYASYNGTTVTGETPVFDTVTEWDQITITGTGTDNKFVLNWNITTDQLMDSSFSELRIKTNCSKDLKVSIKAVKFDGVTLTSVSAYSSKVRNGSQTVAWNITPMDALILVNNLNPDATDEVYFQIIFEGYDSDNYLEVADVIQFQVATGENGNVYAFSNIQILRAVATLGGVLLILIAFGSTKAWNPVSDKGRKKAPVNRAFRFVKAKAKKPRSRRS